MVPALALSILALMSAVAVPGVAAQPAAAVELSAEDFAHGTYIIDRPGTYRLIEDISFNPNHSRALTEAIQAGIIHPALAAAMDLEVPVDAFRAGFPLFTQFLQGGSDAFTPGGLLDARYDPAAFGVGFFAAIAITADGVILDLNGHTIEQSAEHALLQRFFAVVELADQPFVASQGPADFGTAIESAHDVTIQNGTIGRSSHHGIHGNGNSNVVIRDVDFRDYEVGAVALNGVDGLLVEDVTAVNRKDVPVLGTFSSAQFIKPYVDELIRQGSTTTLSVQGVELSAGDIRSALRQAINNTHHDIVNAPNVVAGRVQIDAGAHPLEYGLFANPHGVVDGNSYSFLVNAMGVAVDGFPMQPDHALRSQDVTFRNVTVRDQHAAINEVPALDSGSGAATDPVGAVFQVQNTDPGTGNPMTTSSLDSTATYTGNPVANAQALVAKATHGGEFAGSNLDVTRVSINPTILGWVEALAGSESLADVGATFLCNGDSMFHVNKGVIGFKMDAAVGVRLHKTTVDGLQNLGTAGSAVCGDYSAGTSHPNATLHGYGGAVARGFTVAGSSDVRITRAEARRVGSYGSHAIGFAIMTNTTDVSLRNTDVSDVDAGWGGPVPAGSPTAPGIASGYAISETSSGVSIVQACATGLTGQAAVMAVNDPGGVARVRALC